VKHNGTVTGVFSSWCSGVNCQGVAATATPPASMRLTACEINHCHNRCLQSHGGSKSNLENKTKKNWLEFSQNFSKSLKIRGMGTIVIEK
jgi:hypothetical protein